MVVQQQTKGLKMKSLTKKKSSKPVEKKITKISDKLGKGLVQTERKPTEAQCCAKTSATAVGCHD
ncbi:MAG: hypothetical protein A2X94_10835 [Bdellovibrionales bacterium GWB1_55_8]|nr:MAG: hypothetical protein A2X94_10835 [Bdellovibrionales bacterium GWB1_55_8]